MNRKSLIAIAICGVLVAVLVFGAYEVGSSSNHFTTTAQGKYDANSFNAGYAQGYADGNKTGFIQGAQLLHTENIKPTPTPIMQVSGSG